MEESSLLCSNLGPSNDKRMKRSYSLDNINDLPELVLHNILSFLDMKEVVQTSVIAKRWRNLWKFQPILYFDHSGWNKTTEDYVEDEDDEMVYQAQRKQEFMNFVDKVLFESEGSKRCKFYLDGGFYCKDDYIFRWILEFVRQRAEEIYLELAPAIFLGPGGNFSLPYVPLELPDCLFTSPVQVFMLQVDSLYIDYTYQLPKSMGLAPHLKRLHLATARLPKGDSRGEFVLKCQLLEILELVDCDYAHLNLLTISSPQLKHLLVENERCGREGSCKIKINTPSLVLFKCSAGFKDYILENFTSLYRAYITCLGHNEEVPGKSYVNLFYGVQSVTILELFGRWMSKSCLESSNFSEGLPCVFPNLKILKIVWGRDSRIDWVDNLLKKSTNLETLIFEFLGLQDDSISDWGEDLSLECTFDHLKSIEIEDYNDCENDFKFLEFLLRSAVVLESTRVVVKEEISGDEDLVELRNKLQALPKASSTARLEIVHTPIKYVTLSEIGSGINSQYRSVSIRDGKICLGRGSYQI